MTKKQEKGLKDIEALIKEGHIVTKTDKSGCQCLLTEIEYIKIGEPHVKGDTVKTMKETEKNEDILNCHTLQLARVLGLCESQNCARQLKSALLNQNTLPPSLYLTVKDHKPRVEGKPLPARAVCGAMRAHNGQLGFMLAKVVDAVSDNLAKRHGTEINSKEDMLATIEEKINMENLVFISSDVEKLYPSLQPRESAAICAKLVRESDPLVVEGVDWEEACLYLAVTLSTDKVAELGLEQVVPVWKKVATARCNPPDIFTKEVKTALLQQAKDWDKSLFHPPTGDRTLEEKSWSFPW